MPNLLNGVIVSTVGFIVGWLLLDFSLTRTEVPIIALIVFVTSFSCTAFGTMIGAFGLRGRDIFFFANLMIFVFLLFCGVNVPLESLPEWMSSVSPWLPLTHGIAAARTLADGATFSSVSGALGKEAGIGALYVLIGMAMLAYFEWESRRRATLEVF